MDLKLPTHPEFTFSPLDAAGALQVIGERLGQPAFFVPALSMVEPPSSASFSEAYGEKSVLAYLMRQNSGTLVGTVFFNTWTSLPSLFVEATNKTHFDVALTQAALEAFIPVIFGANPENNDILAPVPHPGDPEAELMLATLGFETIGCRAEFEAQMTSYWLQRHIWQAYFGDATPPLSPTT